MHIALQNIHGPNTRDRRKSELNNVGWMRQNAMDIFCKNTVR